MKKGKQLLPTELTSIDKIISEEEFPVLQMPRLSLKIGEWKNLFREDEYKLMIAKALNYCVDDEAKGHSPGFCLSIAGYLVTGQMVYLVMDIEETQISRMLFYFYNKVKEEIEIGRYVDKMKGNAIKNDSNGKQAVAELPYMKLFKKIPFTNYLLVKLITGHKVNQRYYDPYLEELKEHIHNNPFCSAIDYSGADGPVLVKKLNTDITKKEKSKQRKG